MSLGSDRNQPAPGSAGAVIALVQMVFCGPPALFFAFFIALAMFNAVQYPEKIRFGDLVYTTSVLGLFCAMSAKPFFDAWARLRAIQRGHDDFEILTGQPINTTRAKFGVKAAVEMQPIRIGVEKKKATSSSTKTLLAAFVVVCIISAPGLIAIAPGRVRSLIDWFVVRPPNATWRDAPADLYFLSMVGIGLAIAILRRR